MMRAQGRSARLRGGRAPGPADGDSPRRRGLRGGQSPSPPEEEGEETHGKEEQGGGAGRHVPRDVAPRGAGALAGGSGVQGRHRPLAARHRRVLRRGAAGVVHNGQPLPHPRARAGGAGGVPHRPVRGARRVRLRHAPCGMQPAPLALRRGQSPRGAWRHGRWGQSPQAL